MREPNRNLPVRREPSPPPAPLWQQAAPAVVRGAALVAVGVVAQWALRNAAKMAVTMPLQAARGGRKTKAVATAEDGPGRIIAVSETIVVSRRVIVRR
ncbi:MAG: hypothetical protein J4N36_03400 [Chloroflexi bacterium]|nr:hypothetical protein [Chloroflexota bacterium]MCI0783739.1 hypothetical protein [Chloroflexota bacterium]MCI0813803.1 hypothetical protein [Chloroflexota bacterium]MCI0817008.1 hypothetical protein [Chloroflexota bacterium]MCI0818924.1 hypothetical protein [Chloroflexota bacterium]